MIGLNHTHSIKINTLTRVYPYGCEQNSIKIDNKINQIELLNPSSEQDKYESWIVGENSDVINNKEPYTFASQIHIWNLVKEKLIDHLGCDNSYYLSLLLLGKYFF